MSVVHIRFVPVSASVLVRSTATETSYRSIQFDVRLQNRQHVRTPDERSLEDCQWNIELIDSTERSEFALESNALGMLTHSPAMPDDVFGDLPEACFVWAGLEPTTFNYIWELVMSGRLPQHLTVEVAGLEFGWEPDGSGKIWDVSKPAPVKSVQCTGVLAQIEPVRSDEDDEDSMIVATPPTTADLKALEASVRLAMESGLNRVSRRLGWLVALATLLVLFSLR